MFIILEYLVAGVFVLWGVQTIKIIIKRMDHYSGEKPPAWEILAFYIILVVLYLIFRNDIKAVVNTLF